MYMDGHGLKLRVIYRDPPDLLELEVLVQCRGWAARSTVYASPHGFFEDAERLLAWARNPLDPFPVEAGADTGIGWLKLVFYTIDRAGHVACALTLATGKTSERSRAEETWRMSIELRTEPALIENFARACRTLAQSLDGEAELIGLLC
jgi:hypothetical protein